MVKLGVCLVDQLAQTFSYTEIFFSNLGPVGTQDAHWVRCLVQTSKMEV